MKAGRPVDVRGFLDDPVQAGDLCVKASLMTELIHNRHRLKHPLRRVGGQKGSPDSRFQPCSWDEALDLVARRFLELRDAGQAHTIANRTTGRMLRGAGSVIGRILELLGSPNATDVGPVCNDAGGNALSWTLGLGNFTNGYGIDPTTGQEDLGSSRYLLFLGTNQAETHPVTFEYLLRQRQNTKARLVVVDPRRTPTAEYGDEWIGIKPHTDLAFALGMLAHVIQEGLYDRVFVRDWTVGFDALKDHLESRGYSPEWAQERCDIPAEKIRAIAEEYSRTKPAAIFCNAGISHQLNAFTTYRVLAILAAVTGNVGQPGGGCNFMHNTWPGHLGLPSLDVSPPGKTQAALPVGPDWFAESILEGRPYRLRAVMTEGNPLIASANTARVRRAFEALDFYVYTGLFMEEAALYADVVLPVASGLEFDGVYMRRDDRAIRWQEQAVPRVGESRTDVEIFVDLAAALERNDPSADPQRWTRNIRPEWADYSRLWQTFVENTPGMGGMTQARLERRRTPLQWPCPNEDHPGVSTMYLDHPSWYEALEALAPEHRGKRFPTPSGKVELFTEAMDARLRPVGLGAFPDYYTHPEVVGRQEWIVYSEDLVANPVNPHSLTPRVEIGEQEATALHAEFPLMGTIGRASVVHFAGVTQWTPTGKLKNGIRLVQIHPETAKRFAVLDGQEIAVISPRGRIRATALHWSGIRKDTIYVPNSFGPAQVLGDDFDLPRYEAANQLVDDRYFDPLSGQQAYKCFACRVERIG